jgi:hypothetical protein
MKEHTIEQPYTHPAFPQPDDTSITIWRYMNFDKFEWLVNNRRLYMSSAALLSDPREGTNPEGNLKWWDRKALKADTHEQEEIIKKNRDSLSLMARKFRDHYYVSCWHMSQYENNEMWEHYAPEPTAVALRTTYKTLKECLPYHYIDMCVVRYIDYTCDPLPTLNMFEYITHKDIYYKFEQEARAVAFPPPIEKFGLSHFQNNLFQLEDSPEIIFYAPSVDLGQLIHGVVMSPDATPEFKEDIAKICLKNGMPKPEPSQIP